MRNSSKRRGCTPSGYGITAENTARMNAARRLVAVGTTSVRSIESSHRESSHRESARGPGEIAGETDLFIYPGFRFARTGALLTNFHLPRTSLLLLALRVWRHGSGARGVSPCHREKNIAFIRTGIVC